MLASHLREAVGDLPSDLRHWMRKALTGNRFLFCASAYHEESHGTVCPVTAAAVLAGFWLDGALQGCPGSWGDVDEPSPEVVEFAACFDLAAEEIGLASALEIVKATLAGSEERRATGSVLVIEATVSQ